MHPVFSFSPFPGYIHIMLDYSPADMQAHNPPAALHMQSKQDFPLSDSIKFRRRRQAIPSQEAQARATQQQEQDDLSASCGSDATFAIDTCMGIYLLLPSTCKAYGMW